MSRSIFRARGLLRKLKDISLYALFAEAFFIGISPVAAEVALIIGFVAFLYRWKADETFQVKRPKFFWPISIFVICGILSIPGSPDPGFSFYNFYNLVGVYLMTYILVTQVLQEAVDVERLFKALAISAFVIVAYGLFQYVFGIDTADMKWVDGEAFPELKKRIFSTWENPNIFAAYLDILICVLLGLFGKLDFTDKYMGRNRKYIVVAMGAAAFCLAMTYARGACLTLGIIAAGYGVMRDWRILAGLAMAAVAVLALDPVLLERLTTMFTVVDTSSEMRIAMWESTVQMIMDHPLLGIGWGAYWMVYPIYDTYIVDGSVMLVHAHNIYLNYIAEIGIIGGMAYFVWLFGTMAAALFNSRPLESRFLEGIRFGIGMALISVTLNGITDDVLFNIPSSMLLWMLCGVVTVIDERFS